MTLSETAAMAKPNESIATILDHDLDATNHDGLELVNKMKS
jgi:hypothetical protein